MTMDFLKMCKKAAIPALMLIGFVASVLGVSGSVVLAAPAPTPNGASGESIIRTGEINTVQAANERSELILRDIEEKMHKIRPQGTPVTTIASRARKRSVNGMVHEYYSSDIPPVKIKGIGAVALNGSLQQSPMETDSDDLISPYDTLIFPDIKGYEGDKESSLKPFMAIVQGKGTDGKPIIRPVNGKIVGGKMVIPDITKDAVILIAGNAHNETDIQTSPYATIPTKRVQYLQKEKCQIEMSTLMQGVDKEVKFDLTDVSEDALYSLKLRQNVSFLLGVKGATRLGKEDSYTCDGIWYQAGKDFKYDKSKAFTGDDLIAMSRKSFTGNNGSAYKTLICGSGLLERLIKANMLNGFRAQTTSAERYEMEFKLIGSNFGTFHTILDETFDLANKADEGLILDESCLWLLENPSLTNALQLNLRESGDRDVDARVVTMTQALKLVNPNAHMRISPNA